MSGTVKMQLTSGRRASLVRRAFFPSSNNLSQRVVHGAAFTFLGIAIRSGVTIGSMAVLARLLTPADFGHIAMATLVTELAALFSNFGFGSILIQRARLSRLQIDTMFWAALLLGVMLSVVVFGLSFVSQLVFDNALVGELLRALCIVFIFEELTVVPRSLLARLMLFRADFAVQAIMILLRAGVSVLFAMQGAGVWSLVAGSIAGAVAQSVLYLIVGGYWPRLRFNAAFLRETWHTNSSYFGNGLLFYLNSNLDLMLIGRALGASSLGIYQNARSLTQEINTRMAQPLQRVLFPAFAQVQNEPERFRDGIARSGRLLTFALAPVGFGLAAVADEIVPLLYGDQWIEMVPVLQVFALGAGLTIAASINASIFNAKNRVGLAFKLYLANVAINVILIVVASRWGMMGIAYAKLALGLIGLVILRVAMGLVQMDSRDLWRMVAPPCAAAALMLAGITLVRPLVYQVLDPTALRLAALVIFGMLSYGVFVLLGARTHVNDARDVIAMLRGKRGKR
ncbi:lipopolysaccharide biosynthesis protein [Variovorax sp. HJSM1_2]|uniref:lipopolysaccharide biosynthesis protein n=1 Tax=Variovorax sp. HJSM1_2 TaxID=3366263 RepID=UPI003BBCC01E